MPFSAITSHSPVQVLTWYGFDVKLADTRLGPCRGEPTVSSVGEPRKELA